MNHRQRKSHVWTWIILFAVGVLLAVGSPLVEADPDRLSVSQPVLLVPDLSVERAQHTAMPASVSAAETITVTRLITGLVDTEVVQGYPSANCADELGGHIGYDQNLGPDGQSLRTLVRFSLAQIPANATVSQATLDLYVGGWWGYVDESLPINVYRLAAPWAAATTTWNNQPDSAEQHATTLVPIPDPPAGFWRTLDLTGLVQGWVSGAYPNEGLVLRGRESPLGWRLIGRSRSTMPPRLHVEYSYTPTFAVVGVADTFAVAPGQAVSLTVYADAVGGFTQTVGLEIGSLPANTSYALANNTLSPPGHTTLWLTTTASTPVGTYTCTVTGTASAQVQTAPVILRVSDPDFDLAVSPSSRAALAGAPAQYTLNLDAISGFDAPVTLELGGAPAGASLDWSQNPVTPTASAQVTITTAAETPLGAYSLTITGTGGGQTHSAEATLDVRSGVYLPTVLRTHAASASAFGEGTVGVAAGPDELVILSIGISDYENMPWLSSAERAGAPGGDIVHGVRGAVKTAQELRAQSDCPAITATVSIAQCQACYHKLLLDAQATKAAIHAAIVNWLDQHETQNSTVIVYFSGHGMYAPDDDGDDGDGYDEFLVPYDIDSSDGINWDEDMAIRDDELAAWLSVLESQRVVVLVDSCFSGGVIDTSEALARGLGTPIMTAAQWQDGFAQDVEGTGRVILTASTEGQPSWEFGELQDGAFTYYLREAFRTPGADENGNGWISAEEAYRYLDSLVDDYVWDNTNPQTHQNPQLYDGVPGDLDLIQVTTPPASCPWP